jgi:hypothetical protein
MLSMLGGEMPGRSIHRQTHSDLLSPADLLMLAAKTTKGGWTALSNWLSNTLGKFDVMNPAGHSCFETTSTSYLAVRNDLLQLVRAIT